MIIAGIELDETQFLLDDLNSDIPTVWCMMKRFDRDRCFTMHPKDGSSVIFMNLHDLFKWQKLETPEDILDRLIFAYIHEVLHALGGIETKKHEVWTTLLSYELVGQNLSSVNSMKKGVLDGTIIEVHE